MKKKILAGILSAATIMTLTTGLTGCQENKGPGNGGEVTDGGQVLTILAWGDNADITNMVKVFLEKKGYDESKVQIQRCGTGGGTASAAYEQYLQDSKADADLLCLEADWILDWINEDSRTAPLSTLDISESNLANPYSYTKSIGKNDSGALKGVTFQACPGGFVYRADLAKQHLGVNSPDEMQALVKDWSTLESTAKTYKDKSGKALLSTEAGLWQVYQYNRSTPWVKNDVLQMGEAESFYDVAKTYYDNGYMTNNEQWVDAWYASVANGDALGEFLPTWGMTDVDDGMLDGFTNNSGDTANLAFCQGPQFYAWGGTWLGVSARCDNKTLAKEFVEFFTCDDAGMKAYTEFTGDFCNNDKVMQEVAAAGHNNKFLVGGQDQFKTFLETAPQINLDGKLTRYDAKIKGFFNDSVRAYMTGAMTKEAAIEDFKSKVVAQFGELKVNE